MKRFREIVATSEGEGPVRAAREAAGDLRDGHLIVHPTCTVYGIGGRSGSEPAVRRLKGEGGVRPLLRIAASREQALEAHPGVVWSDRAEKLARRFWPGPLTLVLEDGTADGVALRVEEHLVTRELLAAQDGTMTSSSLNRTGYPPARTAEEARGVLQRMPESRAPVTFLNAGDLPPSAPSTILSLRTDPPEVLRAGALPVEDLRTCLGDHVPIRSASGAEREAGG